MWSFLETLGNAISEFLSLSGHGPQDPELMTAHFRFRQWFFLILAIVGVLGVGTILYLRFGFHL
jgi:hypothetical protein